MNVLIFAHRNEAIKFIEQMTPRQSSLEGVYNDREKILLLTGEGKEQAISKTSALVAELLQQGIKISKLINLGVAGSLNLNVEMNRVISARTVYGQRSELDFEFKSFTTDHPRPNLDIITANNRVLTEESRNRLAVAADIVDREAWAVGLVAQQFGIPFFIEKVISDFAGAQTDCFEVKKKTLLYSQSLFDHYQSQFLECDPGTRLNVSKDESLVDSNLNDLSQFIYFTNSTRTQVKKLMKKLIHLEDKNRLQALLENSQWIKSMKEEVSPKKRALILKEKLIEELNPISKKVNASILNSLPQDTSGQLKLSLDSQWEQLELTLSAKIRKRDDIDNIKNFLDKVNYNNLEKIFHGEIEP